MRIPPETGPDGAAQLISFLYEQMESQEAAEELFALAAGMSREMIEYLPPLEPDVAPGSGIAVPEGLEALFEAAERHGEEFALGGSLQSLAKATDAWRQIVQSPLFDSAEPWLRAMVLNSLAISHQQRYLATGDEDRAVLAQDVWRLAIAEAEPGDTQHRELASNAGLAQSHRCARRFRADLANDAIRLLELACDSGCPSGARLADSLRNLSGAFYARFEASGAIEDIDRAIERARLAASMATEDERLLAEILTNLGTFLIKRDPLGSQGELVAEAVEVQRQASLLNAGPSKPAIEMNLAEALAARHEWFGEEADIVEAISILRRIHGADLSPETSVRAKFNLGIALVRRYLRSNDPAVLDEASQLFEKADEAGPPGFIADARASAGRALSEAFRKTGNPELLDRAVYLLRLAASGVPEADHRRVGILHSLAIVLDERFDLAKVPRDFEEAEAVIREAVQIADATGKAYSALLSSYSNILRSPGALSKRDPRRLALRLEIARRAVEASRAEPPSAHAAAALALSNALSASFQANGDVSHLREAITFARQSIASALPGNRASAQGNLAELLRHLHSAAPAEAPQTEVTQAYRDAVRSATETRPASALASAISWGVWAMARSDWPETVEAARAGVEVADRLGSAQADAHGEGLWLERSTEVHEALAYALAKVGDIEGAVVAVEAGRANAFYRPLQLSPDGKSVVFAAPRPTVVDFHEIAAASAIPLVYLIAIPQGGLTLFVLPARNGVPPTAHALWADEYDAETSEALLMQNRTGRPGWLKAYLDWRHNPQRDGSLNAAINALGLALAKLWQVMLGEVVEWLIEREIESAMFLPSPILSVLPLHAACDPASGRAALDDLVISYAPCVTALSLVPAGEGAPYSSALIVADDRMSGPLPPLPFAPIEATIVAAFFPSGIRLDVSCTGIEQVCYHMHRATILHFACHGRTDHDHPLMSCLSVANDADLPLGLVLSMPHASRRLALLIGCDTGLVSLSALHRGISLSSAFIAAGYQGVIGSQWALPDWCGTLLTLRMLDAWSEGQDLASALRLAQLWVRDTGWDEKIEYIRSSPSDGRTQLAETLARMDLKPDTRPPFYWAACRLFGT